MPYKLNPFTGNLDYYEAGGGAPSEYDAGNSGSSITIDWANGSAQALTLTANTTVSFSNGKAGATYQLRLIQDTTGSRTITYSPLTSTGKIIPPAGVFPTLTGNPSVVDFMHFYYDGTYYYLLSPDKNYTTADFSDSVSTTFDGISKYVTFGNKFGYDITSVFSVSAWVKVANSSAAGPIFTKLDVSGSALGYEIYWSAGGTVDFGFYGNGTTAYITNNSAFSDSVWNHLVFTYDGTDATGLKMYLNGSLVTCTVINTMGGSVANTADCTIACRNGTTRFLAAKVDEVSMWNVALSSGDISTLYNSGSPTDLSTTIFFSNCTNWYRMGDSPDTASIFYDQVGTDNGTPTNIVSGDITTDVP